MKRILLFRLAAIILLSVSSLCLRSEKMACEIKTFHSAKSAQINTEEIKNNIDGLLPYYPIIIKI